MSQGTPINKLGGNSMNNEDSRLVDSILNDLNSSKPPQQQGQQMPQQQMPQQQMPQQGGPPQQMSPEQHKAMLAQRQQQMMQQQQMMMKQKNDESILDKIQSEWKSILLVIVLSVIINTGFIDGMFKMEGNTYFLQENGSLNIQATIIKSLFVGSAFFLIKNSL